MNDVATDTERIDKAWSLIKATWIGLDSFPVSEWREKVWNDLFPMLRDTCDEIRDSDGLVFRPLADVKLTRETMFLKDDFDFYDFMFASDLINDYEITVDDLIFDEGIRFYISDWSPCYWFTRFPETNEGGEVLFRPIGNYRERIGVNS